MDFKNVANFVSYLERFIGRPYIWAGDGTGAKGGGFDCSGLVLEGLWAFGLYSGGDVSSENLRRWCADKSGWESVTQKKIQRGDIMFFGKGGITHTAVAYGDGLMLEAGGGAQSCVSDGSSTGFVRIRPISRRKDFVVAYRPEF